MLGQLYLFNLVWRVLTKPGKERFAVVQNPLPKFNMPHRFTIPFKKTIQILKFHRSGIKP